VGQRSRCIMDPELPNGGGLDAEEPIHE